jgi:hypothetical protein
MRVVSGSYTLTTRTFDVVPAESLRVLGAELVDRTLVLRAQNPTPDTTRSVAWRPVSPEGGTLRFFAPGGRPVTATWDAGLGGWTAPAGPLRDGATLVVPPAGLVDGLGNRSGPAATVTVGQVAPAQWPAHMGTGNGRPPGLFGEGTFPP